MAKMAQLYESQYFIIHIITVTPWCVTIRCFIRVNKIIKRNMTPWRICMTKLKRIYS